VDDEFDFPPSAHPGRELFTAGLCVLLVLALLEADFANISATKSATPAPPTLIRGENHELLAHWGCDTNCNNSLGHGDKALN
jgi:hypothetical protein